MTMREMTRKQLNAWTNSDRKKSVKTAPSFEKKNRIRVKKKAATTKKKVAILCIELESESRKWRTKKKELRFRYHDEKETVVARKSHDESIKFDQKRVDSV